MPIMVMERKYALNSYPGNQKQVMTGKLPHEKVIACQVCYIYFWNLIIDAQLIVIALL
jgi:hypothetical protein